MNGENEDYEERLEILINNLQILRDATLSIQQKSKINVSQKAINDLSVLIEDLENMKESANKYEKEAIYEEGLRRMSKVKSNQMSESLRNKLEKEIKGELESWNIDEKR